MSPEEIKEVYETLQDAKEVMLLAVKHLNKEIEKVDYQLTKLSNYLPEDNF